jgi:hypothetical protein
MITNLVLIVNIIGGDLCDHLMRTRIFTLTIKKKGVHVSFENYEESGYNLELDLLIILY